MIDQLYIPFIEIKMTDMYLYRAATREYFYYSHIQKKYAIHLDN